MNPAVKSLADRLEALLPQTQCTKCGFNGCRPYAEAMASGAAACNRCPPGGAQGIARLAALLGTEPLPLDPERGSEQPRAVARIDESLCIGCTLCIQACPVDAIAGAAKQMHTVIPELCTGCDLCVPPCPVDCIDMVPVTGTRTGWDAWSQAQADAAQARYLARNARLVREREENDARLAAKAAAKLAAVQAEAPENDAERAAQERKRAIIQAAIERARQKQQAARPRNTDNVSAAVQAQIDAAEARRARAGLTTRQDDPNPAQDPANDPKKES
ncbi:electron transport complex subunit RsxB [Cupriavidus alkaliphilus]|uniref:electron transport complex subunit RsxB n=1 Tax=Cupriavidus alkaliphilus TaxID=942866 RepID=UPI0016197CBD|nr:electron transport complex subunit RsxB [Cupriavidus alkaliphilus]MBB2918043.1 electron transport complex protein RnfB [Cupriavidus alkaliphilus]MBB3014466.1 electron transport complex protein RnfB [Cupriavidus alkaliphilus]